MTQDSLAQDSLINERREAAEAARIVVIRNGPYELDGSIALVDHLGIPVAAQAPVRLCRCGQSQTKPFCDDSHLSREFTDNKDPRRVTDNLEVYEGQQAYVYDNRGTCAHSGLCTDRLNSVFHLGREPFISPSGARLDDLVNAVRRCPSGALGIGIGPARDAGPVGHTSCTADRDIPGRALSHHGERRAGRRKRREHSAKRGRIAGTFQPVPMRVIAQQAVLQRDALERRIP